jgi:branched-chain amino acid transport system substrate-binding protein
VAAGAESYARERGFQPITVLSYGPGTADFGPIIGQLKELRPDLVLDVGRIEDDVRFAQQLAASGIEAGSVGLIATPLRLFKDALGDAAEGFLGPSQWEPGVIAAPDYGPTSGEVMRSLARTSPNADYPMAQVYAGCLVAQRCIEEAGTLDNAALRRVAARLDFTTFYGRFIIEPATGRQIGHQMPVVQWRGGVKRVVWPRL